ncbi:clitocypin cysteine proteinase inhibitor [Laccaria bicolor S238N-H82]|uniref:Clitocypin cysteine proteinase inhibitor n=1 Tax=Laccaria bicolor (strain S238N-H82 / ATCC MYA-4686) TaxID=486041 RepID=B0D6Z8_LACBS|nr:clitocypin cysteine proteinase inhibitor [Laccaria bicolor S238N-H82]EDR09310.1 clitocypin cysteine proteinase inhibitor [Laccaria bicolor S238N-H82]|eukprot:XP_001879659.1 clitocypin cysteine proteinase inhibitor [Laccaria bicolor S238N-H82]
MSFESGYWSLKAGPVIGVGGMYATENGLGNIVSIAAQVPSTAERQVWKISVVEPKEENIFTIVLHNDGGTPGEESWSLRDKFPVPHGPISTSEEISQWRITRADNGLPSSHPIISIQPITPATGGAWFVGTEGDRLVIIPFPIDVEQPPVWQATPHHN